MTHAIPARPDGAITLISPRASPAEMITLGFLAGYKTNTRQAYEIDLRLWGRFLARHDLDPLHVQRAHIEYFMRSEEERGLKAATVSRRVCTVTLWYRYAHEEGHMATNPAARVRLPKVHDDAPADYLDRWDLAEIVRVAGDHPRLEALALVCLLGLDGLRISEALGLNVASVGSEGGYDVIRFSGKGDKPAVVPLAPVTSRAVEALRTDRAGDSPLWVNTKGRRMTRRNAHDLIDQLTATAKIRKHITPHSFRRSFVSVALDSGVSLTDVQMSARHSSANTTLRYDRRRRQLDRHATHVVAQQVAAAMR